MSHYYPMAPRVTPAMALRVPPVMAPRVPPAMTPRVPPAMALRVPPVMAPRVLPVMAPRVLPVMAPRVPRPWCSGSPRPWASGCPQLPHLLKVEVIAAVLSELLGGVREPAVVAVEVVWVPAVGAVPPGIANAAGARALLRSQRLDVVGGEDHLVLLYQSLALLLGCQDLVLPRVELVDQVEPAGGREVATGHPVSYDGAAERVVL